MGEETPATSAPEGTPDRMAQQDSGEDQPEQPETDVRSAREKDTGNVSRRGGPSSSPPPRTRS